MSRLLMCLLVAALAGAQDRIPSPSGSLFVHYTDCNVNNPCIPEVVVTIQSGTEVRRFQVKDSSHPPCMSIMSVEWAGENAIAAECHVNPSRSNYLEMDAASGKVLHEYVGYGFVRSPDLTKVAHVGPIVHFAPGWAKSEYLQVGNTTVYPLPPGKKPYGPKPDELGPDVVVHKGLVYAGVHEFRGGFTWSPDSRRIGFVDCLEDYRVPGDKPDSYGEPENPRCFVVAVELDGTFRREPIPQPPSFEVKLSWSGTTLTAKHASGSTSVQAR